MGSIQMTFVCLLGSLPTIAGLSCLKCQDFFLDTDNQLVKAALNLPEVQACRAPVDNKTTTLPTESCSGAMGEEVNSCFFEIATASASGGGESVTFTYTSRGCIAISKEKLDTCVKQSASGLPSGVSDAEGSICYCATDKCNGQTRPIPAVAGFLLGLVTFYFLRE